MRRSSSCHLEALLYLWVPAPPEKVEPIEGCGRSDKAESCNIYIEHKADGSVRFDCFTLGCDDGTDCRPVKDGSIEIAGQKITKWVCRCVKPKK